MTEKQFSGSCAKVEAVQVSTTDSYDGIGNVPRRVDIIVLNAIVFLAMVALSLKIKTPGIAALRPLHYTGIGILFFYSLRVLPAFRRRLKSLSISAWMLLALYALLYASVFLHTLGEPVRSIKDFLTGTIIDIGLLIVLLGVVDKDKRVRNELYTTALCWTFVCFAVMSFILAWFMYYGLELSIGELRIGHNDAWGTRLHGIQGEPTHLGVVMGLGIISGLFLYERLAQGVKQIVLLILLVFMGATVFAAGSRNSMLSVLIALSLMMAFSMFRLKLMIGICLSVFGGLLLMMLIVYVAGSQFQSGLVRVEQAYEKEHQQPPRDKELPESIRHLKTSFRLGESSAISERTDRILRVIAKYSDATLSNKLTGLGYGALKYGAVRTSFNAYIDTVVRFGMIHLILLLLFLTRLAYRLYQHTRVNLAERELAIFGMVVLGYAVTFAVNMSTMHTVFFHVGAFCFTIAIAAVIMCDSRT